MLLDLEIEIDDTCDAIQLRRKQSLLSPGQHRSAPVARASAARMQPLIMVPSGSRGVEQMDVVLGKGDSVFILSFPYLRYCEVSDHCLGWSSIPQLS